MQRLRQLEASWLRSGQTTSLFASVIEKDDVRDDLGGILDVSMVSEPHQATRRQSRGGVLPRSGRYRCSAVRWSPSL